MQDFLPEDSYFSFLADPISDTIYNADHSQSNYIKDINYTLDIDFQQPEDLDQARTPPYLDDPQERIKTTSRSRNSGPKRKYTKGEQPQQYRSGKWTLHEKQLYDQFIARYASAGSADLAWRTKIPKKKRTKIFVCMSLYIQSRSQNQCRSYDQKQTKRKQSGSGFAESLPETNYVHGKYPYDTFNKTGYRSISEFSPVTSHGMNECQYSTAPTNCSPFEARNSEYGVDLSLNFNVQDNVKSRLETTSISNMEKLLLCDESVEEDQGTLLYLKMMRKKMLSAVEKMPSDTF